MVQNPDAAANAASTPPAEKSKGPTTRVLIEHDHSTGEALMSLIDNDGKKVVSKCVDTEQHKDWLSTLVGMIIQIAISLIAKK